MTPVHLNFACFIFSHPLCERRRPSFSPMPASRSITEVPLGLRNSLPILPHMLPNYRIIYEVISIDSGPTKRFSRTVLTGGVSGSKFGTVG